MEESTAIFNELRDCIFSRNAGKLKDQLAGQASTDIVSSRGESLIGLAAACGFTDMVEVLLVAGADINIADKDDLGYTPLIRATKEGKLSMVQFLVEKGADLEKGDTREGTPLLHSCIAAHKDILDYLISKGANADAADNRGQTPLHYLCQYAKQWGEGSMIVKAINSVGNIVESREKTRFAQHTEIFETLLAASVDINRETNYGYTPLHWAANTNTWQFVKLLIAADADIHHANTNGYTPLHGGADTGAFESCARLLDFGADKNVADKYGFTPLIGAVLGGHERVVQLLLDCGADKNHKVTSSYDKVQPGDTALDVAVKLEKKKIIEILKS